MRVINRQMNQAILDRKNWKKDNTCVRYEQENEISKVYLHGNLIAEIGDTFITLYDGGYQSKTTKDRLNALLQVHGVGSESVYQKNYTWFFRDAQGHTVPFCNGLQLN